MVIVVVVVCHGDSILSIIISLSNVIDFASVFFAVHPSQLIASSLKSSLTTIHY